jgi:signal transduction histidine kinase
MARRIALIVIALVAVLLGSVAVPLGLVTAAQDNRDFAGNAVTSTDTVANVAEEHLGDHASGPALRRALTDLKRQGDLVAVYLPDGQRIAGSRMVPGLTASQLRLVGPGPARWGYPASGRILVIAPVTSDSGAILLGVVALSRSTAPLHHRELVLWTWIALVSLAGLAAAMIIAAALARWVSRPLATLQSAAQRLGDRDFGARAPASKGPPEVRELAANFNQMAARLEALLNGHQAMMADVSHQLRTPLAALRLRLDVLGQDAPAPFGEELAGAQEEVARLSRMVDGLLAVARAENVTAAPVAVPVHTVISDRSAAWHMAAEEKPASLRASAPEPLIARMAEGHLEQILDNLLANALEAVPAGGLVTVGASQVGSRIHVVVADNGPGMTDAQQRAAFRRFVSDTPGGSGLGLAIVHRLVTADSGTAVLSQTPGGGLTVTIEVPAAPRDRQARRPAAPANPGPRSLSTLKNS